MRIHSIGKMLEACHGLCDTKDVTDWQNGFIKSVYSQTNGAKDTSKVSERQYEVLEQIYNKHFG